MALFKEHQLLLMRRESRSVLGRHWANLWMLVAVLTATFLSIAFSDGSMNYLNEKMNDPFTFWLNVTRESKDVKMPEVRDGLLRDTLMSRRFHYDDVQTEMATSLDFFGKNGGKMGLFSIQHYQDMGSDLIAQVLGKENAIRTETDTIAIAPAAIDSRSLGVIMTLDAIKKLGYSKDDIPAFVDCHVPANHADTLDFTTYDGYVRAPLPLLGVVRRLPMNKDIVASKYLYIQHIEKNDPEPFNLSTEEHARRLYFFVPDEVTDFDDGALQCLPDSLRGEAMVILPTESSISERLRSWKAGCIKTVYPEGNPPAKAVKAIERDILAKFADRGVVRVYNYSESLRELGQDQANDNSLSIHFRDLDSITKFEDYMKDTWKLQIEMSKVNSLKNFNEVSKMANILTVALLLFAIVSIVIFIVDMMHAYFQKVRRNMGTFKAFGISTGELIRVYVTIIVGIVVTALVIALTITLAVKLALLLFGITKEGGAEHLIVWNIRTGMAVVVILAITCISVLLVMRKMLQKSPGDLIYDRG